MLVSVQKLEIGSGNFRVSYGFLESDILGGETGLDILGELIVCVDVLYTGFVESKVGLADFEEVGGETLVFASGGKFEGCR
jgi:hypothetical protein